MNLIGKLGLISVLSIPSSVLATPELNHVQAVVNHLEGKMDTSALTAAGGIVGVRMTTCRVSLSDRPDAVYLYQEHWNCFLID
ncbi:MAG: hypothetical protein QNJ41_18095 [Xenococcaceae cyanobacterium MO_188.B32]|nr:hypothetical protein [Xenococcaceae cyanobacterium MO_188.B32]